jgi:hypothetical protein
MNFILILEKTWNIILTCPAPRHLGSVYIPTILDYSSTTDRSNDNAYSVLIIFVGPIPELI